MFKLFEKKQEKPDLMEYEADVIVTPVKEQITEISPLWEEVFERMDAIEAKIDLLFDNQNF